MCALVLNGMSWYPKWVRIVSVPKLVSPRTFRAKGVILRTVISESNWYLLQAIALCLNPGRYSTYQLFRKTWKARFARSA